MHIKQNFKKYLKLGILLFGISVMMVNCQKDDDQFKQQVATSSQAFEFKVRKFKDLAENSQFNTVYNRLVDISNFETNMTYRSDMEEFYNFTIDSTIIKEISKDGYVSYTFLIRRAENDSIFLRTWF